MLNLMETYVFPQALDAAFAHYDADVQKRSAKSGERTNGFV